MGARCVNNNIRPKQLVNLKIKIKALPNIPWPSNNSTYFKVHIDIN